MVKIKSHMEFQEQSHTRHDTREESKHTASIHIPTHLERTRHRSYITVRNTHLVLAVQSVCSHLVKIKIPLFHISPMYTMVYHNTILCDHLPICLKGPNLNPLNAIQYHLENSFNNYCQIHQIHDKLFAVTFYSQAKSM